MSLGTLFLCYRPIILDPADPTHNVAEGYRWDIVAQRASQCLKQDCCYDNRENPISSWNVKVMAPLWAVKGLKLRMTDNLLSIYSFSSVLMENRTLESPFKGQLHHPRAL